MDNYNPDLIFDLAAGLLPDGEARTAEAGLTADGRAELASQRAVLAAIAAEPIVAMNDIERVQLHRSVAEGIAATTRELSPVEIAQPRAAPRHTRSIRWMRWASVATAAALVVGVVAVGSQLTNLGSKGDSADTLVDADPTRQSSATTTAGAAAGTALTTTPSVDLRFDAATQEGALLAPPVLDDADSRDLLEVDEFVQDLIEAYRLNPSESQSSDPVEYACFAEASEDNVVLPPFIGPYVGPDGEEIEAIGFAYAGTDPDEPTWRYYRPDTCEQILSNTD